MTRTYFPSVVDGSSEALRIPGGFPFGQSNQTTVYVSTVKLMLAFTVTIVIHCMQVSVNGYFSFGEEAAYNTPQLFSSSSPATYLVTPFWANNDISNRVGNITYEVHTTENSPTYITLVSSFISQQKQVQFNGNWMLVAKWNSVPQFGGSLTNVSIHLLISVNLLNHNINLHADQYLSRNHHHQWTTVICFVYISLWSNGLVRRCNNWVYSSRKLLSES